MGVMTVPDDARARGYGVVFRLIGVGCFVFCAGLLFCGLYFLLDMYAFEYVSIRILLGWSGILLWGFVSLEAALLLRRSTGLIFNRGGFWPVSWVARLRVFVWVCALVWVADWVVFTQRPATFRLTSMFTTASRDENRSQDGIYRGLPEQLRSDTYRFERFKIILDRIVFNHPNDYSVEKVISSVNSYSEKYSIDPILGYYWLYLTSFYGEAPAGRVPFLRSMTSETIRDFVQGHLPSWFVEAKLRQTFIVSERVKGGAFLGHSGRDWQYAVQKATYDVSVEPYDTNVYTDVFLILREYRGEFPELFLNKTPLKQLDFVLADSFLTLDPVFMRSPCESPEACGVESVWGSEAYEKYRVPMKKFARAAFYKMVTDLDFATKVQVLVARYYQERFVKAYGAEIWGRISHEQQVALLAMLRDVYTPNIGHPSANAYNLPEFNLAPFAYVRDQALNDRGVMLDGDKVKIWIPKDGSRLWSASGTKLRVLSEVWKVFYGSALPGVQPTETVEDARGIMIGLPRSSLN